MVLFKQLEASKAEKKRWNVFHHLRSFFKGEVRATAGQPIDEPVVKEENGNQLLDEHDRSMKSENLNLEDWPLEDGFKSVSDFLDSMPCNSQSTEQQKSRRVSSPSSVSSSDRSSLHKTSIQIETTQNLKLEALEQHMDEVFVWLAQSEIRREKLLARVLAQMQTINSDLQRPVHIKTVTIED